MDPDHERSRCDWELRLSTVVTYPSAQASDVLGTIEFDPTGTFLATGGISRKIRIYPHDSLLPSELQVDGAEDVGVDRSTVYHADHDTACAFYICAPAKLSSLRWKPGSGSRIIAAGDYDGAVTEYDLERRVPVTERDEHGGRKVWSVDYSHFSPHLAASGSDDGSAQLWDSRSPCLPLYTTKVFPGESNNQCRSAVCSVEFDPNGGPLLGLGSANRNGYLYDLRMPSTPVTVFHGHRRTVTYVRFVPGGSVLTASTDGSIRMWDSVDGSVARRYQGHENKKSFVGLSVFGSGGLLGCGSESNEVFVYDIRWGEPIWVQGFQDGGDDRAFVSAVCWKQRGVDGDELDDRCMLVAAGSNGVLQVSVARRKRS